MHNALVGVDVQGLSPARRDCARCLELWSDNRCCAVVNAWAPWDYRRAFDAYEARLRRFVEGKQAAARKFAPVFATQTGRGIWFRNLVMRTMNFRPLGDLVLTRSLRDDFELPNYPL